MGRRIHRFFWFPVPYTPRCVPSSRQDYHFAFCASMSRMSNAREDRAYLVRPAYSASDVSDREASAASGLRWQR